jgi:hypothetical protein
MRNTDPTNAYYRLWYTPICSQVLHPTQTDILLTARFCTVVLPQIPFGVVYVLVRLSLRWLGRHQVGWRVTDNHPAGRVWPLLAVDIAPHDTGPGSLQITTFGPEVGSDVFLNWPAIQVRLSGHSYDAFSCDGRIGFFIQDISRNMLIPFLYSLVSKV